MSDGARRILVVDDEPSMRSALTRMLEPSGYAVLVAKDGAEALEVLDEMTVDVVLTDLMMPGMDAFELLRAIRKGSHRPKVIVMSGRGRAPDEHFELAKYLGAVDTLAKPFSREELVDTVRRALRA